jgi:hypothetical protein
MARFGSLRYPWQRLLYPYRTHDLCPVDLCPSVSRLTISVDSLRLFWANANQNLCRCPAKSQGHNREAR